MKGKTPTAKPDDDSSQQPRQHRTPSGKEQMSIDTEDRTKARDKLSAKIDDKKRPQHRRGE